VQLRQDALGVDDHAAELQAREVVAVTADAGLPEEDGTAVVALDLPGRPHHDRRHDRQKGGRPDDVEGALGPAQGVLRPRPVEVEQRQASDRPDPDAFAGNVRDARRHDHLDVVGLEVPDQVAHGERGVEGATDKADVSLRRRG
jgi:hypothetical protein